MTTETHKILAIITNARITLFNGASGKKTDLKNHASLPHAVENKMKKLMFVALAALIGAVVMTAGCTSYSPGSSPSSSPQTSTASQNSITMKGLAFNPSALTINKGANVTWTNDDTTAHTVTSDTGAFDSGNMNQGATFTHQFNDIGTFSYHCNYHSFMKGTITVQ